jgi:hypothetical protein
MQPVNNRNRGAKVSSEVRHPTATWHAGTVRSPKTTLCFFARSISPENASDRQPDPARLG